ncbi:Arylsulfatase [Pontiella sulfatireligans]|uniref:Arylsulfatase n=2 Tax=Pontiella sulfatireligans TaxID=2750658 RepID=A0A6C2UHJ8_9BACT|nr:sulfatase S1_11 [Kiritimatiellales bacterium]VGO18824.1 Arylsulfatase [Pontiella sulfatireligans]
MYELKKWMLMCAVAGAALSGVAEQKRSNILFIFSDDHASEAISAYGSWLKDYAKTPNIDRLAKEGMLFRNLCCNNSICSPSRASVMTGQYDHVNGVMKLGGAIKASSPWLSKELKKGGYQTWLVGKWHIKTKPQGFDDYRVVEGQGTYFDPKYDGPGGIKEEVKGYSSDKYTDKALDWLQDRDRTKPFCMMLQFKAPHHPYDPAPRHMKLLEDVAVPEPPTLYEDIDASNSKLKRYMLERTKFHMVLTPKSKGGKKPKPNESFGYYIRHVEDMEPHEKTNQRDCWRVAYQHMVKTYIRCITAVDENVGRMIDYLEDEGLMEETIIIYTADQGYWLGQHGFYDKRLILDESLKMPFLIRYPRMIKAGTENQDLCSNVDIAPTLLEMTDLPVPGKMQGRSMVPLLKGSSPPDWRDAIWYNYVDQPQHYGIRTKQFTLVHFHGSDEIEFYDNKRDPNQTRSVHDNPEYREIIQSAEIQMKQVMADVGIKQSQLDGFAKKKSGKK